ncbi:hypothetical protein V491_01068 [Pseudogymnoascus sp. VKM F-3775]|nr:hypothetical protein V491_01068 [Pseudogymnoascus sp. VKM F-3775]
MASKLPEAARRQVLLRLGEAGSDKIVLVLTEKEKELMKKLPQFACLSYRWGVEPEDILRTTTKNYNEHLDEGIILNCLPKTIIDAVIVCWKLSIDYLWVDSLCIIQPLKKGEDDMVAMTDWLLEGSTMDNAYGNSYLTIYAEDAPNCKAGFLTTRGRKVSQEVDGSDSSDSYEALGGDFTLSDSDDPRFSPGDEDDGKGSVLDRRGWCLQENIIPNRQLHFYNTDMRWECNHHSEGHFPLISTAPTDRKPSTINPLLDIKPLRLLGTLSPRVNLDSFTRWRKIIEDYSKRDLSKNSDNNRLMPISGVASLLLNAAPSMGLGEEEYCAGLWRLDFIDGLSWKALYRKDHENKLLTDSGPTWSWASVNSTIVFLIHPLVSPQKGNYNLVKYNDVQIISINCTLRNVERPTGAVDSCIAELEGLIIPVQLVILLKKPANGRPNKGHSQKSRDKPKRSKQEAFVRSRSLSNFPVYLDHDSVDGMIIPHDSVLAACWKGKHCIRESNNHSCVSDTKGFFALRLRTWKYQPAGSSHDQSRRGSLKDSNKHMWVSPRPILTEICYLVLKRLEGEDGQEHTYHRVGIGLCGDEAESLFKGYEMEAKTKITIG